MASKMITYSELYFIKEVQAIHTENYNTLLKEIKEDLNKYKYEDILCNRVKMVILPKMICRFHKKPIKIPIAIYAELRD